MHIHVTRWCTVEYGNGALWDLCTWALIECPCEASPNATDRWPHWHYDDVIMTMLASQITSLMVVYSIVYLGVNQRKHQSSASLAFVREIHRGPVNFPHKWPVTRKMFPLDDVIMRTDDKNKQNKAQQNHAIYFNIDSRTKWLTCCRRHFSNFYYEKLTFDFDWNFHKVCS